MIAGIETDGGLSSSALSFLSGESLRFELASKEAVAIKDADLLTLEVPLARSMRSIANARPGTPHRHPIAFERRRGDSEHCARRSLGLVLPCACTSSPALSRALHALLCSLATLPRRSLQWQWRSSPFGVVETISSSIRWSSHRSILQSS